MATELASAYVSLVPSFRGGAAALSKQLGGPAGVAGKDAGGKAGKGFLGGFLPMAAKAAGAIGLALGGAKLIGGIKNSITAAGELETKFREVVTLFGETGDVADASFGNVKGLVKDLSNEFGIAQETLVGGLYQAISAGVPRENAFTFMQVASKAAIGGVTDVETAVDGITTVINAFGLGASDAQAVADSMFTAVKGGKTNFEELSASLFNVAPAAAAANVSMEEVNAAIATLTAGGTPTSVATTQIRAALAGLSRPSKELDSVFQSLGYQNAQLAIESEGLGFALDAVKEASKGNNGELQLLLGSQEAVAAANVLAGTGAQKFADELVNQSEKAGAATDAYDEVNKSAARQFELFKNQLRNVGISISQTILPALTKLVTKFGEWLPRLQEVGSVLAQNLGPPLRTVGQLIGGVVVPAVKALGGFLIASVVPAVASFGSWLQRYQGWLIPIAAGIGAVVVALKLYHGAILIVTAVTKAWTAVQAALNVVMRANPIGIIITVLVALGAALVVAYKRSETFRNVVQTAWTAIQAVVKFAWQNVIKPVIENIVKYYKWAWEQAIAMKDRVVGAFNKVRTGLRAVWQYIRTNVLQPWVDRFNWVRDRMVAIKDSILKTFRSLRDTIGTIFSAAIDKIKAPIRSAFKWINKNLIDNLNKVTGKFGLTIPKLPEKFHSGGIVGGRGERIITALGGEGVLSREGMQALGGKKNLDLLNSGGASGGVIDFIKEKVSSVGSAITGWLREGAAFALDKIMGAVIGAAGAMPAGFGRDFTTGILKELRPKVKAWGAGEDASTDGTSSGAAGPPIATSGWARPLRSGYRIGRGSAAHGYPAQDLPAPIGTPIFAPIAGRVIQSLNSAVSYGNRVMLSSPAGRIVLAHMSRRVAQFGDILRAGQLAGYVGSTGNSTGPHLHLEIGRHDPLSFLRSRGVTMDTGGYLPPGHTLVYNGTGGPERVLNRGETRRYDGAGMDARALAKAVASAINGATIILDDRGRGRLVAREADLFGRAG